MLKIIIVINLILILTIIIYEYKHPRFFIFWSLIIFCFSIIGFGLYVVFGNKLKFKEQKIIKQKKRYTKNYLIKTSWYKYYTKKQNVKYGKNKLNIIKFNENNFNCKIWHDNKIIFFYEGEKFLNNLLHDIKNAKNSINLEFYIFSDDQTGKQVSDVLISKAQSGVTVNIIYDAIGSKKTNKKFFNNMRKNGINVFPFFPSPLNLAFFNLKINYRNHRKIVVIDGSIGYVGGLNLRNDHMGKNKKVCPWRDTHVKILGNAVYALQNIFLNDFVYVSNNQMKKSDVEFYFPKITSSGKQLVQILDDGPENDVAKIYISYLKILSLAKKELIIQTPYFIVNKKILDKIIEIKQNGTEVKIVIPGKPDKKIVYSATLHCVKTLLKAGVEVYLYNGFIHSKVLITENCMSVGTVNFDYRSFNLNFEVTALIYDNKIIQNNIKKVREDIKNSQRIDKKTFNKLYSKYRIRKIIYLIFSKIM